MIVAIVLLLLVVGGFFAWKNRDKLLARKQSKPGFKDYKPNSYGAHYLAVPTDILRKGGEDLAKFAEDLYREANEAGVSGKDFDNLRSTAQSKLRALLLRLEGTEFRTPASELLSEPGGEPKPIQQPRREESKAAHVRPNKAVQPPEPTPQTIGHRFQEEGLKQYPNGRQMVLPPHAHAYEEDPDMTGYMPPPPRHHTQQ